MSRIVSFLSIKGGVGKTSILAELAINLAKKGYRVCVFDAYFNINGCSSKFESLYSKDIKDYLGGNMKIHDVINHYTYNLDYVMSNSVSFDYLMHGEEIKRFIRQLGGEYDYFLIDVNCFNDSILDLMLGVSNEAMVILDDHEDTIRNTMKLIQKIHLYKNINNLCMTINQARIIKEMRGKVLGEKDIEEILKEEVLFVFPKFVRKNMLGTKLPIRRSCFLKFSDAFISNTKNILNYQRCYKGPLGLIKRRLYEKYE